ncbi:MULTISPECIES: hypothetical protein [unclassified Paenibacillus]|uniref:hypothetical protein n=1 Tax=unclassified Paenibacillus TaxID=185978 RepID=UPI002404EA27|nr:MULTISPECIES: hypothetical protein [unclassified Paenibacillus]MDF9840775.1 hypothetical protein [Paenibacillus sp. PastF-2]MDF9847358.1 hypothetical protein [Paenibacillus sp. PastM-2]MDF9854064.1 hypothetical protein [Paenibacillus sp. PastF-1]MDH6479337.1 hypothetical protein [Paenibacillus sp. PastH-2]MDH6506930.1 hypothetical protein [Paenibacillus sp. PastM-3]
MTKMIKFNLIINNMPVRTIEELRQHFFFEEVLNLYRNGLLHKWLSVRGYKKEHDELALVSGDRDEDLINQLIRIFDMGLNEQEIEEEIYILKYKKERLIQLEELDKLQFTADSVIDDYHNGYQNLIQSILNDKEHMPRLKAHINELCTNYMELFKLNFPIFFTTVYEAPLAIFAMLMREELRPYLIHKIDIGNTPEFLYTKSIYNRITALVFNKDTLKQTLGEELKSFKGVTDGYWKDIESKEKRYLIIHLEATNVNKSFIRNAAVVGEELSNKEVNEQFLLLDGIDYKSNYSNNELLYMEV